MHCNFCGKKFIPHKTKYGWEEKTLCKDCWPIKHPTKYKLPIYKTNPDTYCVDCGKLLTKTKRLLKNGKYIHTSTGKLRCHKCRTPQSPRVRKCVVCGNIITTRANKYCSDCKSTAKPKKYPLANRRSSVKWQKNNPKKVKVQSLTKYLKVQILYECPCECEKKHNHHFDYDRPFEVIRLCPACHSAEHIRLKWIEKEYAAKG